MLEDDVLIMLMQSYHWQEGVLITLADWQIYTL